MTLQRIALLGASLSRLWTPSDITTALWLDADDASTITTVSGAVSQWNDKSGNERHATQSTSANRPAYQTGSINGRATVAFDGVNDVLTSTMSSGLSGSFTIAAVVDPDSTRAVEGYVVSEVESYSNYWLLLGLGGSPAGSQTSFSMFDGSNNPVCQYATPSLTVPAIMIGTRNTSADTVTYHENGTLRATVTDTTTTTPSYSALRIGAQVNAANRYATCKVCEVVILSFAPTTDQLQRLEGYLAHRWGLTANLPADHPYKSAAPTT